MESEIRALTDLVSFGETLCALTEMKEIEHNNNSSWGVNEGIGDTWALLISSSIEFEKINDRKEWDGEWYEELERFYETNVRDKIFKK